ncbi:MAG: hypothetical protein JW871_06965 [Endomicrobiales bacterium]|nr:hypothetical protein [Endomicrobiales bacterium]
MAVVSCKKKKKLATSTVDVAITPVSISLDAGASESLTASVTNAGKEIDANPTWAVSNTNLGQFSPEQGKKVTFTAGTLSGSAYITAIVDDITSNSASLVVSGDSGGGSNGGGGEYFYVYKDYEDAENHYIPHQWWGDQPTVDFNNATIPTGGGSSSMKFTYTSGGAGWGAILWTEPYDNNGDNYPTNTDYDLSDYTKLTFWAKSDTAGNKITVQVGGFENAKYPDSSQTSQEFSLSTTWDQYELSLAEKDLTKIQLGFYLGFTNPPFVFYLDEIKFEN